MRERGTGGERVGRRTSEIMRGRHRGESMKETILTDRGRQTCKEEGEMTEETQEGKETRRKTKQDTTQRHQIMNHEI